MIYRSKTRNESSDEDESIISDELVLVDNVFAVESWRSRLQDPGPATNGLSGPFGYFCKTKIVDNGCRIT